MTTTTREAALEAALNDCIAAIEHADMADGVCCCGDNMENHSEPMNCGHSPVDAGEYHAHQVLTAARTALAARPAPQPAAEHEYPDPLIAEDRYEDDQPAVDMRVGLINRMDAVQACQVGPSDEWAKATKDGYNQAATDCAFNILKIKPAIIGTATPAPSDKIAEAAIDRCMQEIEDIICEADVSYPAGRDAGTSIDFDRDAVLAALRALAGKGE